MKLLAPLMIALTMVWAGQAFADFDNSNKDHTKHENNAGGNGDSNSNSNNASSTSSDGERPPSAGASPAPDQNSALDAVSEGSALPLSDIAAFAQAMWGGRTIDAKLLKVHSRLVYQLTMLSDQGVSRRVYYDAASGRSLKAP